MMMEDAKLVEWAKILRTPELVTPGRSFVLECPSINVMHGQSPICSSSTLSALSSPTGSKTSPALSVLPGQSGLRTAPAFNVSDGRSGGQNEPALSQQLSQLSLKKRASVPTMQLLMCSDGIFLFPIKKKSTLSRKKVKYNFVKFDNNCLKIVYKRASSKIVLFCFESGENCDVNRGEQAVNIEMFFGVNEFEFVLQKLKKVVMPFPCQIGEDPGTQPTRKRNPTQQSTGPTLSSRDRMKSLQDLKQKRETQQQKKELEKKKKESLENRNSKEVVGVLDEIKSGEEKQIVEVLREIFVTERDYVESLQGVVKEYLTPLKSARSKLKDECYLLDPEDVSLIFNNTESLLEVNKTLLTSISSGVLKSLHQQNNNTIKQEKKTQEKNEELETGIIEEEKKEEEKTVVIENKKIKKSRRKSSMDKKSQLFQKTRSSVVSTKQSGIQEKEPVQLNTTQEEKIARLCAIAKVYAEEFGKIIPFLRMYSIYCHQYSKGVERLAEVRKESAEFDGFVLRRENKKNAIGIQSLLIKPVQRICKYPLLFRELTKHMQKYIERTGTKELEKYVELLTKTQEAVEELASAVNEKVSQHENQHKLMEVYLELGGSSGHSSLAQLLQPSRRYTSVWDIKLREAPFATQQRINYRLYLFNDLIVLAKSNASFGKLGAMKNGTLRRNGTLSRSKLKVTHYMELLQCSTKEIHLTDAEGMSPLQLTRVFRQPTKSQSKQQSRSTRFTTAIEKFEIWLESKEMAVKLMQEIDRNVEEILVKEETRDCGSKKKWAARNRKRRASSWRSKRREVGQSDKGVEESSGEGKSASIVDPKSPKKEYRKLDDLKSKYSVKPREMPSSENETIRINISFPKGPLGLALENRERVRGVFVACVAACSVAERGGLLVGDRLISVGSRPLDADITWESVVEMIRTLPRPLSINFERTQETVKYNTTQ